MKFQRKNPTTISSWVLVVAQALRAYGHNPEDILEKAGIDKNIHLNPDARIKIEDMSRLWKLAVKTTGDPCFGLSVGAYVRPTTFHALGFAMMASSSLNDAFRRMDRYYRIITNAVDLKFEEFDDTIAISFNPNDEGPQPTDEAFDALMAAASSFTRTMLSNDVKLLKIELIRKMPKNAEKFVTFFESPVIFSADHNRFFLNKEDVSKPLPAANVEIARRNDEIVVEYLERFHENHIVHQVHTKLIDLLPRGEPSLEKLAKAVNMSKRNLNRYIKDENTTYHSCPK